MVGTQYFSLQGPADKRAVPGFRTDVFSGIHPFPFGVKEGQVGSGAFFDVGYGQVQGFSRTYSQDLRQFFRGGAGGIQGGKGRFQAQRAGFCVWEFQFFGFFFQGCVVGTDQVDGFDQQGLQEGFPVVGTAQGRGQFQVGIEPGEVFVGSASFHFNNQRTSRSILGSFTASHTA